MTRAHLLTRIETAKRAVSDAENDLKKLVDEIVAAPRAEKTWISEVVEDAFAKLNTAKENLINLERLLASEED